MGELVRIHITSKPISLESMRTILKHGLQTRRLRDGRVAVISFPERPRPRWEKTA